MTSTIPAGSPVWIDMTSSNFPAAQAFYQQLFGWKFEDVGNYHVFSLDGHPLGALTATDPNHQPAYPGAIDQWTVFLHSDNLPDTITRALAAGGEVLLPETTVYDWGVVSRYSPTLIAPSWVCGNLVPMLALVTTIKNVAA